MAVSRPLVSLGKVALLAALVAPPAVIWLSGRFAEDASREPEPAAPAPRATLPRSETAATPSPTSSPPPAPDVAPSPAPTVSVGPGVVTVAPVPGALPPPAPREGRVVGEPQGLPDPNRSEAMPP